jgi:adenylate cyclase
MGDELPKMALETRRLAAIMFTDIVGFSRQMGVDEARMLGLLDVHNQIIQQAVATHHGAVIKTVGDAFLVDFPSVVHAVQCAQAIQAQFRTHNTEKETTEQIHVRIGIHSGDIVQKDGDVFGDGVNIASRLQELAEPDTICISDMVYRDVAKKLALGTVVSLGRPKLKNIAERFQVYVLLFEAPTGFRQTLRLQRLKLSRRVGTAHLARAALVVVGLLIGGGIVTFLYSSFLPIRSPQSAMRNQEVLPLPDKPSIVVLAFKNLSSDPEQEYFSDGLTEDITADLSKLSGLFVIARNSAFTYKGKAVKVQEISREMGVRYVLEGSVRKAGEQVRVTVQLIDGPSGGHVWSERYDRPLTDIFALQDEIVQQLVTMLRVEVREAEQERVRRIPTANLTAYDSLLRGGEYFFRFTKEGNVQARQLYEQSIALDPQFAGASVMLGWTYGMEWFYQWSPDPQNLDRAFALARQALALDDTLPLAHGLLSWVYRRKHQPEPALSAAEQAVALDPNNDFSHIQLAESLMDLDRPAEAVRAAEQVLRLNPRSPFDHLFHLGRAYYLAGRYEKAIAACQQALLRNPNYLVAYAQLVLNYAEAWLAQLRQDPRTPEQALEAAQRAVVVDASSPVAHLVLSWASLLNKQYDQAVAELERGLTLSPGFAGIIPDSVAESLNSVGRPAEALRVMEQALRLTPQPSKRYFLPLGRAYYLLGRTEEAIEPLQRVLSVYPHLVNTHVLLTAAYSEVGREPEARAEAAEVLRLNPQFSLEVHKQRAPIKDPAVLERHIAALRKAGLK